MRRMRLPQLSGSDSSDSLGNAEGSERVGGDRHRNRMLCFISCNIIFVVCYFWTLSVPSSVKCCDLESPPILSVVPRAICHKKLYYTGHTSLHSEQPALKKEIKSKRHQINWEPRSFVHSSARWLVRPTHVGSVSHSRHHVVPQFRRTANTGCVDCFDLGVAFRGRLIGRDGEQFRNVSKSNDGCSPQQFAPKLSVAVSAISASLLVFAEKAQEYNNCAIGRSDGVLKMSLKSYVQVYPVMQCGGKCPAKCSERPALLDSVATLGAPPSRR